MKGITGGNPLAPPRPVWALAGATVLAHLAVAAWGPYGFHRDEYLALAMGARLGRVPLDVPPLVAAVAAATRAALGDALWALRLPPALAHGALVLLTASLARQFSAPRAHAVLAAAAVAAAPVFLRAGSLLLPDVFDQLWWTLALFALITLHVRDAPRRWLLVGGALGLGLLTTFRIASLAGGVAVATLLGARRRDLVTPWPWAGAAVALLVSGPTFVAQARLDWPLGREMAGLREALLPRRLFPDLLAGQSLLLGPVMLLALAGAAWLVLSREVRWARDAGVATLVALALLTLAGDAPFATAAVCPLGSAAGAAALARMPRVALRRWATAGTAAVTAAFGALALPLGLPFLAPGPMAAYAERLGVARGRGTGTAGPSALPRDHAAMLGWERQVAFAAQVWQLIPDSAKATAVLLATNSGRAGALDLHGPRYGLPPPISTAGSFWYFGAGDRRGAWVVSVGPDEPAEIMPSFEWCDWWTHQGGRWVLDEERFVKVWLCHRPRVPLDTVWARSDPRAAGRRQGRSAAQSSGVSTSRSAAAGQSQ